MKYREHIYYKIQHVTIPQNKLLKVTILIQMYLDIIAVRRVLNVAQALQIFKKVIVTYRA